MLDPAIAKWPNVPACYEWLSLDRRGDWRLQGERVTHRGLIDFLNGHYAIGEDGCCYVQNGPQRVYVDLAYTPWIFRRSDDGFTTHTGQPSGAIHRLLLDEEGNLLLDTSTGIGLLDDRDLAGLLGQITDQAGQAIADSAWLAVLDGAPCPGWHWRGIPLFATTHQAIVEAYRFTPAPRLAT